MKYEKVITLKSDNPIQIEFLIELTEMLKQRNIGFHLFNEKSYAIQEAQRLLKEKGTSYILSIVELREAVLPKAAPDQRPLLVQILSTQLSGLSPSSSLIIIDPYFFAETKDAKGYMEVFASVFGPIANNINKAIFITNSKFNKDLYNKAHTFLSGTNNNISITHRITEDFHDRFWIVDEARGMFVGTSINGIGKRYALTDYMQEGDVKAIVEELRRSNLI